MMATDTTQSATTEASSMSQSSTSTVSTASTRSTSDSPSHLISEQPETPPRVVHVLPEAAPYAQLYFQQKQSRLITVMVGSTGRTSPNDCAALTEETGKSPDLGVVSSGGSSGKQDEDEFEVDWDLVFGDGSSSSNSSSACSQFPSSWEVQSTEGIVWMDAVLFDSDRSMDGDTWLLGGGQAPDENSVAELDTGGCGFIRARRLRKSLPKAKIANIRRRDVQRRKARSKDVDESKQFDYSALS